MINSTAELLALQRADARVVDLEPSLLRLEQALGAMHQALCNNEAVALETAASTLHKSLLTAVSDFRRAALAGRVSPPLRQRLVLASGQVAALRQALARATASLDRAIDVLLPEHPTQPLYDAHGGHGRQGFSGLHA